MAYCTYEFLCLLWHFYIIVFRLIQFVVFLPFFFVCFSLYFYYMAQLYVSIAASLSPWMDFPFILFFWFIIVTLKQMDGKTINPIAIGLNTKKKQNRKCLHIQFSRISAVTLFRVHDIKVITSNLNLLYFTIRNNHGFVWYGLHFVPHNTFFFFFNATHTICYHLSPFASIDLFFVVVVGASSFVR